MFTLDILITNFLRFQMGDEFMNEISIQMQHPAYVHHHFIFTIYWLNDLSFYCNICGVIVCFIDLGVAFCAAIITQKTDVGCRLCSVQVFKAKLSLKS